MRWILPFVFIFLLAKNNYAQTQQHLYESLYGKQLIESEKQGYESLVKGNTMNNRTVASGNFDINFYRCEWKIDPAVRFISGKITSFFTVTQATDNITFDLSDTLNVDSIIYHGVATTFQKIANDGLLIQFPGSLNAGQNDSVSIYYQGVPKLKASFKSFNQYIHSGTPVISTLSEPYGAKDWWPCKNGLTKADSLDVIITSPIGYRGTSNGVLINEEVSGANRVIHFKHRYPIATYLVCLAVTNYVTDFDSVQLGNKTMPLIMNSYPEFQDYFKSATFCAKQTIVKFSELFGEYPFIKEHYSQTQISTGGGMEHQTNTFIGNADQQIIAHELGHHWFGDMVTCGSWQHIWLNEGFGNYTQFLYVQNFDSTLIMAHLKFYSNLIISQPDGSVFVSDTTNPARVFDGRLTYAKGGYLLHMLRGVLGDSIFFKGLRQYLNDPLLKYKFAFTSDLERNLEQVSGKNLQSFFQKWFYGEGYPNYNCTWTQNSNNWIKVQINQTTSHPSVTFYEMPVQLEFKNSQRDTIITVSNTQNGEVFWVNPGFAADTLLIDPKYWILAKDRIAVKMPAKSILPDDIKIYPNPAPDHLTIQLLNPTVSQINIHLYNTAGQLVYKTQKSLTGRDELITISTARFAKANYVLTIFDNEKIKFSKVIAR